MIDVIQWRLAIGLYNIKGTSSRTCCKECYTIQYCTNSDKLDCDDDDITNCSGMQVPGGIVYSDNDNSIDIPRGAWSIYDNSNKVALLLYYIIILFLSCVLCGILSYIWLGYYHNQNTKDTTESVVCRSLLLLSGDVETNPGPVVTKECPNCTSRLSIKKKFVTVVLISISGLRA